MRVGLAFLVVAALWAGGAEASSFVVLDALPAGESPSVITLGIPAIAAIATPEPPAKVAAIAPPPPVDPDRTNRFEIPHEEIVQLSRSVIAMGEPEPDIAMEKVASIDTHRKPRRGGMPLVIRGGVVGDAFSAPVPAAPVTVSSAPASPEQPAQAPTSPYAPGGQPAAPDPALPPPPAPSGPKLDPE